MKWLCKLGWHTWYYGRFCKPVYARYERHCLECPKTQFADYINKKRRWVDFVYEPEKNPLGLKSENPIEKGNR